MNANTCMYVAWNQAIYQLDLLNNKFQKIIIFVQIKKYHLYKFNVE